MGRTGDITETELTVEWKINNFSTLSQKIDSVYDSRKFRFYDASWDLSIYPNGERKHRSNGWVGLYLMKTSLSAPLTVNYTLGIKSVDRKMEKDHIFIDTKVFNKADYGWGTDKLISRSELMKRKSEMTPSDILTVFCTLKIAKPNGGNNNFVEEDKNVEDSPKESPSLVEKDGESSGERNDLDKGSINLPETIPELSGGKCDVNDIKLSFSETNAEFCGAYSKEAFRRKCYSASQKNLLTETGSLSETRGEVKIEWEIKDFFSLSREINKAYHSPKFYFSGTSWRIHIFPNCEINDDSGEWLGLYLTRMSNGLPVTLKFSLYFKCANDKKDPCITSKNDFNEKGEAWGNPNFISRSELMKRKAELADSDVLTVICILNNDEKNNVIGSLFCRYDEVCENLKSIYENAKRTDTILKVDGENIGTHRMILESRSPVFAAMFNHDTKENQTGEITVDDVDKNTMKTVLEYMYSGDIDNLTAENALSLYAAAEKYDVENIKLMCEKFIMSNLSVDWICDVLKFCELYENEKIEHEARKYFRENARKILKTNKWKRFSRENHIFGVELLGSLVMDFLPE